MDLADANLVFIDVETTGLCPATGDRIVEVGMVMCRGQREIGHLSRLVNPQRSIPQDVQRIHGIRDGDVAGAPAFVAVSCGTSNALHDAWLVGHHVRFDLGFLAMEMARAARRVAPAGCLDTRQLAAALWDLPDHRLATIGHALGLHADRPHRALADACLCRAVFHRIVEELGGWHAVRLEDLQALHTVLPTWPDGPIQVLPGSLYDALSNGQAVGIRYMGIDGGWSDQRIHPVACFAVGPHTFVRASCNEVGELRTLRLDRIMEASPDEETGLHPGEEGG